MTGYDKELHGVFAIDASDTVNMLDVVKLSGPNKPRDNNVWNFTVLIGAITVTPKYDVPGIGMTTGNEAYTITSTNPLALSDVDDFSITETTAAASVVIVSAGLGTA